MLIGSIEEHRARAKNQMGEALKSLSNVLCESQSQRRVGTESPHIITEFSSKVEHVPCDTLEPSVEETGWKGERVEDSCIENPRSATHNEHQKGSSSPCSSDSGAESQFNSPSELSRAPSRKYIDGSGENDDNSRRPYRSQDSMIIPTDNSHPGSTAFVGLLNLSDQRGWKQKIYISYRLSFNPVCEDDNVTEGRLFTEMELDRVQIRVAQSTFGDQTKPPQFRIRRAKLCIEPSIAEPAEESIDEDYREEWIATDQYPSAMSYRYLPSTVASERSIIGRVQAGLQPQFQLEIGANEARTKQLPAISQMVDLNKSEFHVTPFGGLLWDYEILPQTKISDAYAGIELEAHRGTSVVPKANPPSSIGAVVTSVFEVVKEKQSKLNFSNSSTVQGISIGYRHIKASLKVNVHWSSEHLARFPRKDCPGGHQLKIAHQFRGGCENTIAPRRALLEGLASELKAEGMLHKK